jgi:protein-tyrosine phosphatase
MSYVDLHLHLLPGVDDGARDLNEALAYARRLANEGVREVTVTPHINSAWPLEIATIPERVRVLQAAIDEQALGVIVHSGGELRHDTVERVSDDELDVIAHGPSGSRWVLLEAPFAGLDESFSQACEQLRERGFGTVIAHPERAAGLAAGTGLALLREQIAAGAVLQVSVCSLLGNHGLRVQESAAHLLRSGLSYVIASDAHPGSREHTLRLGLELALRSGASSVQAWRLTQANPRFLLAHGIPPAPTTSNSGELVYS